MLKKKKGRSRKLIMYFMLFSAMVASIVINRYNVIHLPEKFVYYIEIVLVGFLSLVIANLIFTLTEKKVFHLFEHDIEIEQRIVLTKLYEILLFLIAGMVILHQIGVSISNLTIFIGLLTTGFAFAIKDIIYSYIIWFIVLTKHPIRLGDYIQVGSHRGNIIRISMYYITLKISPFKDGMVKIPNRILLDQMFKNYGKEAIIETLRIPIKEVPKDAEKRMSIIKKHVEKLVLPKEKIDVGIVFETNILYFQILYPAKTAQDFSLQTRITIAIQDQFRDILKLAPP